MSIGHYLNCTNEDCERYHCVERRDWSAKLEAAQRDSERLDWVIKNEIELMGLDGEKTITTDLQVAREAIDAEMAKELNHGS